MSTLKLKNQSFHKGKILLGVTKSDAHVVANHLIAFDLREKGYQVENLGACTPIEEFILETLALDNVDAILIGSLNGHGLEDIRGLKELKELYDIRIPIIMGGNLSVGKDKNSNLEEELKEEGIDYILKDSSEIAPLLEEILNQNHDQREVI